MTQKAFGNHQKLCKKAGGTSSRGISLKKHMGIKELDTHRLDITAQRGNKGDLWTVNIILSDDCGDGSRDLLPYIKSTIEKMDSS